MCAPSTDRGPSKGSHRKTTATEFLAFPTLPTDNTTSSESPSRPFLQRSPGSSGHVLSVLRDTRQAGWLVPSQHAM